ncbi:MAG: RDD family protein [Xanthomonadales bacterium]|nr:RDD family protein [Xanthomonadales bacterium]
MDKINTSKQREKDLNSADDAAVYCRLLRRLMVILYDSFAVLSISFLLTALWVIGNSGEAVTPGQTAYPLYLASLFLAAWFYFAISWRKGGATLGMRAWKIKLVTDTGDKISWMASMVRFCTAWLGLIVFASGFILSLLRKDRACWHDLVSHSRLVRI